MNKHTPGPWTCKIDAHERGRIYANRLWIASTWKLDGDDLTKYIPAIPNAALIAAAPDLLAALQGIIRSAAYESGQAEPSLRELTVGIKYLDAARAAIAKAEGGAK